MVSHLSLFTKKDISSTEKESKKFSLHDELKLLDTRKNKQTTKQTKKVKNKLLRNKEELLSKNEEYIPREW